MKSFEELAASFREVNGQLQNLSTKSFGCRSHEGEKVTFEFRHSSPAFESGLGFTKKNLVLPSAKIRNLFNVNH